MTIREFHMIRKCFPSNRFRSRPCALLNALLLASLWSPSAAGQDVAAGAQVYEQICAPCHGERAEGNKTLLTPAIRLQQDWYLLGQLEKFRKGIRGGHPQDTTAKPMKMIAGMLSEQEVQDVAAYVGSLSTKPSPLPPKTIKGDATRGAALYATCIACHGPAGRGNPALRAPDLTGQWDWYIVRQLEKFRSGIRGSHPKDVFGAQMKSFAALLPDHQAVLDVSAYIAALKPAGPDFVPLKPDPNMGRALYMVCVPCHGIQGEGNALMKGPALAGQEFWYVIRQLKNFQNGVRGWEPGDPAGTQMRSAIATLNDDALQHISAHIATLHPPAQPPASPLPALQGDLERGRRLYLACAICHGEDGSGSRVLSAPGIAGLEGHYLERQLKNYRAGIRGANMRDPPGRVMRAWAASLEDEQAVRDVAAYLASLPFQRGGAQRGSKQGE